MGLRRKIMPKRTTQVADAVAKLRPLKMKRPLEGADEEASGQLTPLTANNAGIFLGAPPHSPPAPPKKPRLVLGCSLDGFKVLSVMDLRCFLH
ncbi:hypothetical protein BRADI_3g11156v3 [Brachypodium distachyon]|uniref:Uncharacterized protein n=1 Tax=Brachypodium distachyon TaxID=15368 RepID=A0A0Q3HMC4_BRADI|nr:hypothetical protein BRADI_3g11156v3 [Brachypodium distachyon]